jgi:hypothetical protein
MRSRPNLPERISSSDTVSNNRPGVDISTVVNDTHRIGRSSSILFCRSEGDKPRELVTGIPNDAFGSPAIAIILAMTFVA